MISLCQIKVFVETTDFHVSDCLGKFERILTFSLLILLQNELEVVSI